MANAVTVWIFLRRCTARLSRVGIGAADPIGASSIHRDRRSCLRGGIHTEVTTLCSCVVRGKCCIRIRFLTGRTYRDHTDPVPRVVHLDETRARPDRSR